MSYDGLVMNGVTRECRELLVGARVDRIVQPTRSEIIIHLYNRGDHYRLLLSVLAQEARVHITGATPPNPDQPPVFCMVLRKHLEGGRILSLSQQGMDRVLHITVSAMNEYGDLREKVLIAEIMGKHSNLILVDPETGKIIDSMKRITEAVNRYRMVLPGERYVPPPPSGKYPLWDEREETIASRLMLAGTSQALDKVILSAYDGLGPLSVQELIYRAGASPVDTLEYFGQGDYLRLYQAVESLGRDIAAGEYHPEIHHENGRPADFSAIALTLYPPDRRQSFPSVNAMLDTYYLGRDAANLFLQRQRDLEQIIRREQERCRKKAGLQAESVLAGKEAQKWQVFGQLLTANHYQLKQGPEAIVADYLDPDGGDVAIAMDPRLSPLENAQVYFKRYRKALQTAKMAQIYYDETIAELDYLDSLAFSLTIAHTPEELAEIREELAEARYVKSAVAGGRGGADARHAGTVGVSGVKNSGSAKNGGGAKNSGVKNGGKSRTGGKGVVARGGGRPCKAAKGKPVSQNPTLGKLRYQGFDILYGSNNRQNDYLNMKIAKSGDLWFHAQNTPSAHVVVRNPEKKEIPADVVEAAAKVCLWHSRSRAAGRAAIDYTLRQNIWKPKGAKPGMMLYEQYRTIFVTVDEEEIRRLIDG